MLTGCLPIAPMSTRQQRLDYGQPAIAFGRALHAIRLRSVSTARVKIDTPIPPRARS